jgi:hypothetical protein
MYICPLLHIASDCGQEEAPNCRTYNNNIQSKA